MATQVLKDKKGNKIGEIRDWNGRLAIFDKVGNRLGEYDAKTNVTKDAKGNKVGTGNLLATLLR
jgi:hypothetical protein